MGLYLRKSFRAGPIRFNLSKSGLGLSGGMKGTSIGAGPRGTYVHAGRHGLYYRKQLSSGQSRAQSASDGEGCATLLLVVIPLGLGAWLFKWLLENPAFLIAGIAIAIGIPTIRWSIRNRRKKAVAAYKQSLDFTFVMAQHPPSAPTLASLNRQQQALPQTEGIRQSVEKIEIDVYQAVLDKVLDDGFITKEEAEIIAAVEQTITINPASRLRTKKEIFSAA